MFRKPLTRHVLCMSAGALLSVLLCLAFGAWSVQRDRAEQAGELADSYVNLARRITAEAVEALAVIQATPTDCGPQEIAHLRALVLNGRFIKAAARLDNGQIVCSSITGRVDPPAPPPRADLTGEGGRRVSFNVPELGAPGSRSMVLREGDAMVSIHARTFIELADPRLDFALIAKEGEMSRVLYTNTSALQGLERVAGTEGALNFNGRRYEVRCLQAYTGCIVAALRPLQSLWSSSVMLEMGAFGVLLGMTGGFAVSALLGRSRSLSRQLLLAMRSGELRLVYQPIVRLSDRRRVGAEALLRWTDVTGKPVSPDAFISEAERNGMIGQVTRFVISRVLEDLGDGLRRRPDFQVTVNVSADDLMDSSFLPFLSARLQAARLQACSIGLELTERTTANSRELSRAIARVREAGHKVYIDDFGTDYSSLSYLSRLRVDAIKINRTFMQALHDQSDQDTIAPQIVVMAEVLGLTMVVEGIEEEQQATYFHTLAPDALAQGWLFSKPVEAAHLFS
ncbi:EAL domain-containing protein [Pseudacidovorax sp. RU35E]|uniref:EAL domain-containing protein n=1 Tax=Pseudacidovorax sp. RU35E TaxID=1907403 RepID=UPI000953F50D|nr:EAL domain-containing protein [Pseudacidovorax sp. RU35E]SIQ38553.1 sensor c-di-GMP phosphodiesterase, contains CSS-motif sensor and EAL domain [Pseudacidovorax sp. RU35E]